VEETVRAEERGDKGQSRSQESEVRSRRKEGERNGTIWSLKEKGISISAEE
jgi:hypothetical protein